MTKTTKLAVFLAMLGLAVTVVLVMYTSAAEKQHAYRAGFAKANITPSESVYLGGYNRVRKSTGVHDSLYARALVLEDDKAEKAVLVSLDLVGFMYHDVSRVRALVAQRTNIPSGHVIVVSTHQHSGPDMLGIFGNPRNRKSGRDEAYISWTIAQIAHAVEKAVASLDNADIYNFVADGAGLCVNHRSLNINSRIRGFRIHTVHARDIVFVNFACHPEVLSEENTLITRDFVGYAVDSLERSMDSDVLYVNGALGGMVSPSPSLYERTGRTFESAEILGGELANRVLARRELFEKSTSPHISLCIQGIAAPLENHFFAGAVNVGLVRAPIKEGKIQTESGVFSIAGMDIALVPGEASPELENNIQKILGKNSMTFSLANDEIGYILVEEQYGTRTYDHETEYSVGPEIGSEVVRGIENCKK